MRWSKRTGDESAPAPSPHMPRESFTRVFITVDSALVIALAFSFAFGNGWTTARMLGVNPWIAPLIQPAVDLAVVGLMIGLRYLAIHGWSDEELRMPRRWLRLFGMMTLAMNTALPLWQHHWGRAAWDAIGPILLIAWSELAPWLLRAIYSVRPAQHLLSGDEAVETSRTPGEELGSVPDEAVPEAEQPDEKSPADEVGTVIDIKAGTLEDYVRSHLLEWEREGRTYTDCPAAALHRQIVEAPSAFGRSKPWTRRRVNQVCKVMWPAMYEAKLLKTPHPDQEAASDKAS